MSETKAVCKLDYWPAETLQCPSDMPYIPSGTFRMGSTNGDSDEKPVRDVYVSGFCMDRHEVTNAEYSSYERSPSPLTFAPTMRMAMASAT